MASIVVVFPKIDDAKRIKNLLVKSGFTVNGLCTTGAQALELTDSLGSGVVISGYRLADMMFRELADNLPRDFELLLMTSQNNLQEIAGEEGIMALSMPLKVQDLCNTVDMMCAGIDRRRRKARQTPKVRSAEDTALIASAKELLMQRNHMTEEEAHRYLQKCSMDSGTNMVDAAHMVMDMMK